MKCINTSNLYCNLTSSTIIVLSALVLVAAVRQFVLHKVQLVKKKVNNSYNLEILF